jgi:hypothetical protein
MAEGSTESKLPENVDSDVLGDQAIMARFLAEMLDPSKATPENIRRVLNPLGRSLTVGQDRAKIDEQRRLNYRLIHLVVLAHTKGDPTKAAEILDDASADLEQNTYVFKDEGNVQAALKALGY